MVCDVASARLRLPQVRVLGWSRTPRRAAAAWAGTASTRTAAMVWQSALGGQPPARPARVPSVLCEVLVHIGPFLRTDRVGGWKCMDNT